jgi:hypothetical protein
VLVAEARPVEGVAVLAGQPGDHPEGLRHRPATAGRETGEVNVGRVAVLGQARDHDGQRLTGDWHEGHFVRVQLSRIPIHISYNSTPIHPQ